MAAYLSESEGGFLGLLAAQIWPPFIIGLLIGVPSVILYISEVFVLIINRKASSFQSSFFQLFILRALPVIFEQFSSNYL